MSSYDRALCERFSVKDNSDWNIKDARDALGEAEDPFRSIMNCSYRPFDTRSCFFGPELMDRPRRELLDHVARRENLLLLVSRQIGTEKWRHSFVTSCPAESCIISDGSTEQNYCFPIRLFNNTGAPEENFSTDFRTFLDRRYDHHYSSEEILGYVYAILNAPTYRLRYAKFLRIDFPRIPFPEQADDFEALSAPGWALVQAHLMRALPRGRLADYHGKGDHTVEHIRWSKEDECISINATQSFAPVPKDVWDFHIGGYQVIDKYTRITSEPENPVG